MKNKGENHTLFSLKIHIFAVLKSYCGTMPLTLRRRFFVPIPYELIKVFYKNTAPCRGVEMPTELCNKSFSNT